MALKTVTYGVMHFTVAVLVAFALTRDWRIALAIGTVEPLVQTVFFTLHDRIWTRIEANKARRAAEAAAAGCISAAAAPATAAADAVFKRVGLRRPAARLRRAETLDQIYLRSGGPLNLADGALWIRQADKALTPHGVAILHARSVHLQDGVLRISGISLLLAALALARVQEPSAGARA